MLGYKQVYWQGMAWYIIAKATSTWRRLNEIDFYANKCNQKTSLETCTLVFYVVKILRKRFPLSIPSISKLMPTKVDPKTLQRK